MRIVDLAGSEKFKIPYDICPEEKEIRILELTSINSSLSCLGHCISALIDKNRTHIPFRNSKLTRVLSDSLSGQARIAFIVCISPSITASSETFSTLQVMRALPLAATRSHACFIWAALKLGGVGLVVSVPGRREGVACLSLHTQLTFTISLPTERRRRSWMVATCATGVRSPRARCLILSMFWSSSAHSKLRGRRGSTWSSSSGRAVRITRCKRK